MLLSSLIFGIASNMVLASEKNTPQDRVFDKGWKNEIDETCLFQAILDQKITNLDNIAIIEKNPQNRKANQKDYGSPYSQYKGYVQHGTIGYLKKEQTGCTNSDIIPHFEFIKRRAQQAALQEIISNNAVLCNNKTVIINTKDINSCNKLQNEYYEREMDGYPDRKWFSKKSIK